MKPAILFPAEWHPQSAVQLTWPHEGTDWAPLLDEVVPCFVAIAKAIAARELLLIVCPDAAPVRRALGDDIDYNRVLFCILPTNDTWARDHGGISVFEEGVPTLYDFVFNGWGMKYPANLDNLITTSLSLGGVFSDDVQPMNMQPFVLEGGSIESDGQGTLLTTADCLLSVNRNEYLTQEQLTCYLQEIFGVRRVLWLENGYLAGDDTDSHVDTLARFCRPDTIAYVQCDDPADEHYASLQAMKQELEAFTQADGTPYRLIPLPMADPVYHDGERLPATYANFLVLNGAVLVPFYGSPKDEIAKSLLQAAFPDREVVGIDCLALIRQHGSLHCVTMQYPEGFIPPERGGREIAGESE